MFAFYQGVSALTTPDSLLAGVNRPDRYEAELNPSYRELAEHYGHVRDPGAGAQAER